jgi:hypothetical protein
LLSSRLHGDWSVSVGKILGERIKRRKN